jgi:hypothetical protein
VELGLQIPDVAFFALAKGSLSVGEKEGSAFLHDVMLTWWQVSGERLMAYAALFWAFRLDCAGVSNSLSTLFDLRSSCPRRDVSPSRSRTIPLSNESLPPPDRRIDEEVVEIELSCLMMAGEMLFFGPMLLPFDLIGPSKLYSKTAGMDAKLLRLASKFCSNSMLWKLWN